MTRDSRRILATMMNTRRSHLEDYAVRWVHANSGDLKITAEPTAQTRALVHRVFESFLGILLEDDYSKLEAFIPYVVSLRGQMLFNVSTPQRGFFSFRQAIVAELKETDVPANLQFELLNIVDELYVTTMHTLSDQFMHKVNETIESLP